MKIELSITDWGDHVIVYQCKNANEAIQLLFDVAEGHPGAEAIVTIENEKIELDFVELPDFEGEILKLQRKALRIKQKESAKKTNATLQKKNPNHYREAAKKRWSKKIRQKSPEQPRGFFTMISKTNIY